MRRNTRLVLFTGLFLCTLFAVSTVAQAKGEVVPLRNYYPTFTADLGEYKGKRVYLMNFENHARDTTVWYYFSPDKRFAYCGNSLIHNYFWYSFEKALISLGMWVSNMDKPDPYAPAVWMTLKSITDLKYEVEVKIQKFVYGLFFTKIYTVTGEDIKQAERTPENMEKRAYRMTNKLFETILADPDFKKAYFKAAAEMAQSQGN
jgi:hypothetical protein